MTGTLRVLILEDRHADALLVMHELQAAGFDCAWQRVEDEPGFLAHLEPPPDLICTDYSMPQFDALRVLALLRERGLDIPVIIVSGSIGEDLAVAAIRQGASDYLLKDRLARFGLAVRQALEQKRLREDKRQRETALKQYLSMLAHELRNPMAPLLTSIQIARAAGADTVTRERALDTMARSVRQMARLVEDLLEATRITQGIIQVYPERLDLARLVRMAVEDRRAMVEQAGLSLTVTTPETPVWVMGDPTRLAQVLSNLLDNAIRFSDRGARIAVRQEVDTARKQAMIVVSDTGVGIEPDLLPRLFAVFAEGDRSLARRRGGLGLGLAVVKSLVELHRGTVQAASAGPGQGAEFSVRLPLEPEPAALATLPTAASAPGQRLRVLVVEDNRDTADSLCLLLESVLGHETRVAYTGPDGVQAALAWRPDVVLSDLGLPGLNGLGLAAELRRQPATAPVRLIAITGYGGDEDRQQSRQAGFEAHLVKPIDPEELQRLLAPQQGSN
jgi:signal transduction histidine kinase